MERLNAGRKSRDPSKVAEMPFIVSRDLEKADATTRKLIRSHVMQGKKKRVRPRKSIQVQAVVIQPIPKAESEATLAEEMRHRYTISLPRRVGSDLSFIDFADDIELSMLEKRLYPIQGDAAALHISVYAVEDFMNKVLRYNRGSSYNAMIHYHKGLRILRERLLGDDQEAKIADSTLGTILKLASAAHFCGDTQAAVQHMRGVHRIVEIRGGLNVFDGTELQFETCRYDLSIALLSGLKPFFFTSEESFIPYPEELLILDDEHKDSPEHTSFLCHVQNDLALAWRVLRRFCSLANLGVHTRRRMRPGLILDTMNSVMYRLLHMEFAVDSTEECIRLGLLAFSHHVFLQWHEIRPTSSYFSHTYRSQILQSDSFKRLSPHLIVWFLMFAAISLFKSSAEMWLEDALREYIDKSGLRKWKDVQEMMNSTMWVAALDEQPARRIFNSIRSTKPKWPVQSHSGDLQARASPDNHGL
ncbi:unnamed protein product [Clonostachys byssicola]|uniref:Uncharacterized protein n=1 Tax=Clonostachys byssicola TaxID=160290 RepID=A0A9N9UA04_9HYPO|nr:unnamed protein product [Clonostachys byssicola]